MSRRSKNKANAKAVANTQQITPAPKVGLTEPTSIVITVSNPPGEARHHVSPTAHDATDELRFNGRKTFDISGDRSLAEATIDALKNLKPGRTHELRTAMFANRKRLAAARGNEHLRHAPEPRLGVLIQTTSVTFQQLGQYLTEHENKLKPKRGTLEPSMRELERQLKRFDVRWELVPVQG